MTKAKNQALTGILSIFLFTFVFVGCGDSNPAVDESEATVGESGPSAADLFPTNNFTKIFIYSGGKSDGYFRRNLLEETETPREAADLFCEQNKPSSLEEYYSVALMSFSESDQVLSLADRYNIPTTRPVESAFANSGIFKDVASDLSLNQIDADPIVPEDPLLAVSWADFIDGTLIRSLSDAGVLDEGERFWSGTNTDGTYEAFANCDGFTTPETDLFGAAGSADVAFELWMYDRTVDCSLRNHILCVAY